MGGSGAIAPTCEGLYRQWEAAYTVGIVSRQDCRDLFLGIQCGLDRCQAEDWLVNKYKAVLTNADICKAIVDQLYHQYALGCLYEWGELPAEVKDLIGNVDKYQDLRYLMFQATDNPLAALKQIRSNKFLDKPCVVAADFAMRLHMAEIKLKAQMLEDWGLSTGDYDKFVKPVRVLGFQWRARRTAHVQYTNHQFGMAVDINASSNPHFTGAMAAAADAILEFIKKDEIENPLPPLTRPSRFSGSLFTEGPAKLLENDREDIIVLEYNQMKRMLESLLEFIKDARDQQAGEGLAADANATDAERLEAQKQLQLLDAFAFAAGGGRVKKDKDGKKAKEDEGARAKTIAAGNKMIDGWLLHKGRLMDIPSMLIAALVQKSPDGAGLKNGSEYKGSKDPMQFELDVPAKKDKQSPSEILKQFPSETCEEKQKREEKQKKARR
jgi:hypothetical protein